MSFLSSGDAGDDESHLQHPKKRARLSDDALDTSFLERDVLNSSRRAAGARGAMWTPQETPRCFTVLWRSVQTRKHKSWEGDGILVIRGSRATLRDSDSGKDIGQGAFPHLSVSTGDEYSLGSKEVQIDDEIDSDKVLSGSAFGKVSEPQRLPPAPVAPAFSLKSSLTKPASKYEPAYYAPTRPSHIGPTVALKSNSPAALRESNPNLSIAPSRTVKAPIPKHDPAAVGAIVMPRPDEAHSKRHNRKGLPIVDVVVDPLIGKRLREHQIQGVKFLYECVMGMRGEGQGAILADEMGLGKTIQSIALCWTLLKQNPFAGGNSVLDRVLVVCPVTLVKNWAREFRKWLGQDRIGVFAADSKGDVQMFCNNRNNQVLIIGYEKLRTVADEIRKAQPPIGMVICDEGHRLKSAGTKTVQALQLFNTPRRIILSGTPIQNDLSEFHAMADYVNPNALDSYQTFKKMYEMPILRSRDPHCTKQNKTLGQARSEQLHRLAMQFVLRRTGDVVKGFLPPKHEHVVLIAPTKLQIDLYNAILSHPSIREVFSGGSRHLVLISTLKKLCNSPGLLYKRLKDGSLSKEFAGDEIRALFPSHMDADDPNLSGKLIALSRFLKSIRTTTLEKVVLVSSSTKTLDVLEALCSTASYTFCRLDGTTAQSKRQEIVDRFNRTSQDKQFIFLLSAKSGGAGLNLIGASRLVLFDSDWNPSTDLQAMARIHRDGQKLACHIYRFLTVGTLDEKIFQRQVTKNGLAGSLMDQNGQGGTNASDAFTLEELRAIFSLNSDTLCETHDLLGCRCAEHPNRKNQQDDEVDEVNDGDLAAEPSFVAASQIDAQLADSRQKLAALREWTHVDCTTEADVECLEDGPLRALVAFSNSLKRRTNGKRKRAGNPNDEYDGEQSAGDMDTDAARIPDDNTLKVQGGQITFLFSRSSTDPADVDTSAMRMRTADDNDTESNAGAAANDDED